MAPWRDRVLMDLGCGSGYWLPKCESAGQVIGVEPDDSLLHLAEKRPGKAKILHGSAEHIPLKDSTVDVVHARFAYFFPSQYFDPEPGLREVARILKPGGHLVVIDNDGLNGEFSKLLAANAASQKQGHGDYSTLWWARHGATTENVMSSWRFESRAEFEAVLGLEFGETSTKWLDENPDALGLTYGYLLHHWVKPA